MIVNTKKNWWKEMKRTQCCMQLQNKSYVKQKNPKSPRVRGDGELIFSIQKLQLVRKGPWNKHETGVQ